MIEVKINGLKKEIEVNVEGKFPVIVSELMCIIEEILKSFGGVDETLKESAKGFLIETIGEL